MPTDFFGRVAEVFNRYGMSMLQGAGLSMVIALVGTAVGCLIGFAVGIVQTIPSQKGDNPVKRLVLWVIKAILNVYVEVFRGPSIQEPIWQRQSGAAFCRLIRDRRREPSLSA